MEKYTDEKIQHQLEDLKDWKFVDNAIEKKFKFLDFKYVNHFAVFITFKLWRFKLS